MTVKVTEEHIQNGAPLITTRCPLALALSEVMGKPCSVGTVSWGIMGKVPEFLLPLEAEVWRRRFDTGRKVEPFAFEVEMEGER